MLQSLKFIVKCSHKYDLDWKRKSAKVLTNALYNVHNFCYFMIVLVRPVLCAKLVLRYKQKFEAILLALSPN